MRSRIIQAAAVLVLCTALLHPHVSAKKPAPPVSVFDVKQSEVVNVFPLTEEFQISVIRILRSSPELYGGLSIAPEDGIVLHVPFDGAVRIGHEIYPDPVREVYLFLEPRSLPKALVFFASARKPIVVVPSITGR